MVEKDPSVEIMELHEKFVQHIEDGSSRIRVLSVLTVIVALLLFASYSYQLTLPFITGEHYVQVDLLNPTLLATEGGLVVLTFAWLYLGVVNYLFSSRLSRAVRDAREREKEIERKMGGTMEQH